MWAFLKLLNPVTLLWGVLALSLTATGAGLYGAHKGAARDKARSDLVIRNMELDAERRYNEVLQAYNRLNDAMGVEIRKAKDAYDKSQAANRTNLAAARAAHARDADILRQRAEALGCGGRPGEPPATGTAGSDGAAALGGLLADALRVQAELAAAAEDHADAVRSLRAAWPRVTP